MKFFWKLYFSLMILLCSCFSIGSYILIQGSFDNSFKREMNTAYQENSIILSTLKNYTNWYEEDIEDISRIQELLATVTVQSFDRNIMFCLRDTKGDVVFQNDHFNHSSTLIKNLKNNQKKSILKKSSSKYYVYTIEPVSIGSNQFYIENKYDVTSLFQMRNSQIQTYLKSTAVLLCLGIVLVYVISSWLMKPIKRLSEGLKEVTQDNVYSQLEVTGDDEIADVMIDFNGMSIHLSQTLDELNETIEKQKIFIGDFSHELKTPLTSIIGYGDLIRSKKLSEEELILYSNAIVEEGKRLENISMKLMNLTVLKQNACTMSPIPATLFFDRIQQGIQLLLDQHHITLTMDITPSTIYIDSDLMKTVFYNLIDNSRKAIVSNGHIEIKGFIEDKNYHITLTDNGCGIPKEEIDKLTQAFYIVDKSRSRKNGGAGLGLSIVDTIIKAHHATMYINSVVNQGTTIEIILGGSYEAS